jgi:decaprenylphospho-beta-D-erythro-pentofuranosid-2-ulose 2-reductase
MADPRTFLIIGATSSIAEATARLWAIEHTRFFLVARNDKKLTLTTNDLRTRGANVAQALLDVDEFDAHAATIQAAFDTLGKIDVVLIAHGELPNQGLCEQNEAASVRALRVNALSVVSLLTLIANRMQAQGSGVIAVLGSVAGDRGRRSNYVYGSAKALVETFMEGLAGRLNRCGVRVVTIKPGFVDTPMTAQFKKGFLWAQPETIARLIDRHVTAAKSGSYYAPAFWGLVMALVRRIPRRILYRLNF